MLMGARWSGDAAGRINTYVDDPLLNLIGTQTQRDKQLRALLLFWTAAGFKVALGQRDEVQSGQMDRLGVRTRFSKPYGHCSKPSQNCICFQARCAGIVERVDVAFEETPPARRQRRLDHESPSQSMMDNSEIVGSHRRRRTATQLLKSR